MSTILKVRLPFYRRITNGGSDGLGTFYLSKMPEYAPSKVGSKILITHTDVPADSGLKTKLNSISTNTVTALFQEIDENTTTDSITQSDGYSVFFIAQYEDVSFSTNQFGGDCRGYIEYDVNPDTYNILKPVESTVIVNESIPFDLIKGYNIVSNKWDTIPTGTTNILKGMLVRRDDTTTIFANLLKSLNLPVSDNEMKKYTRSPLGTLSITTGSTYDKIEKGLKYIWTQRSDTGTTTDTLVVHPTTGYTGEYYGTVLQPIGSYEFDKVNKAILPIENKLYLIFEIPNGEYGEIIDGKSVKFTLPYCVPTAGAITDVNKTLGYYTYNSVSQLIAYGTYNKKNLNTYNLDKVLSEIDYSVKDIGIRPDLSENSYESNIVLLFSDSIKTPQNSSKSWGTGYVDLIDGTRVFNPNSLEKEPYDHNLDECIGFVALDKGFIVITHPKIVDSYFRQIYGGNISINGTTPFNATKSYIINPNPLTTETARYSLKTNSNFMLTTYVGDNIDWESSQFVLNSGSVTTGITSNIEYLSYNTEKSLNIVCLASSDEFYKSTNDTAKELLGVDNNIDYVDFKSEEQNLYPIMITQIGIHDAEGNLLAICKPSQPIKKYWYDVVSFNVRIRL